MKTIYFFKIRFDNTLSVRALSPDYLACIFVGIDSDIIAINFYLYLLENVMLFKNDVNDLCGFII